MYYSAQACFQSLNQRISNLILALTQLKKVVVLALFARDEKTTNVSQAVQEVPNDALNNTVLVEVNRTRRPPIFNSAPPGPPPPPTI